MKKLFLLDAYALIYRAYYALIRAPRITSNGFNTSAVFGFVNSLDMILRQESPDYIAVCFDPHGPTFRHKLFEQYKAQREAQPEDITLSVPVIKEIVRAYNIPIFEVAGYEADDVIGTIAQIAEKAGIRTYMMTPDKDYGQLVTDNILQWKPSMRGMDQEVRGPKEVCERYGVQNTHQIIDLLALEGDAVDNIPGCPGVGEKTARKLISEYGSVDNLLANVASVKGKLGERIAANADNIRFSYQLATIKTDVPLEVNFEDLKRSAPDVAELRKIFADLEFKSFLAKLNTLPEVTKVATKEAAKEAANGGSDAKGAIPAAPSLFDFLDEEEPEAEKPAVRQAKALDSDYKVLKNAGEIDAFVKETLEAAANPGFAANPGSAGMTDFPLGIAVYAVGPEAMTASLRAFAFSPGAGKARYVDVPAMPDERAALMQQLAPLFENPKITLVSHDIKRDMVLLRREGITLAEPYSDTQLAHYILQPEMRHSLPDIVLNLLNIEMDELIDKTPKQFGPIAAGQEVEHVCQQADMVRQLCPVLTRLIKDNAQWSLFEELELPLARVLAEMEWTGVRIDSADLARYSVALQAQLRELEEKVYDLAGHKFNIVSPSQVGEVLFGEMKLDPRAKRTKTGAYSTAEEVLIKHRATHPIVDLILEVRGLRKLLATYVDSLPGMVNPVTGKIHTTFNQTVTATGRISSANPNLQNIPIRTEEGREVRRAFIPDPGCLILACDYSQIELRLLANLSDDPELTEAFLSGLDIHRATAAKIYHVPYDEVTDDQRRAAKTANFGTVYGISAFGLSERLGIPRAEAKELIESYFATYPHIQEYIAKAKEKAREDGYVATIMGRKRFLPDINSRNAVVRQFAERNAVNAPLQGSAADIIKKAMIDVDAAIRRMGLKSRMILQVHDELVFNVYPEELEQIRAEVVRLMEAAFTGRVPLLVSAGTGANWLEAH